MKHTITEYPNCDQTKPSATPFEFTLPEMYLAMAVSQVRFQMTAQQAWHRMLGAYLELNDFWQAKTVLKLSPNYYRSFKDSIRTHYSSQLGEAFGLLLMDRLGFSWFHHFEDIGVKPGKQKRPDYVFYNPSRTNAVLLECKGSTQAATKYVNAFFNTTVPTGILQTHPWLGLQIGQATANVGLCVGALLNSKSNGLLTKIIEPGLVQAPYPNNIAANPSASVLEHHYGRWLLALGYPDMAAALFNQQITNPVSDQRRAEDLSARIENRDYVQNFFFVNSGISAESHFSLVSFAGSTNLTFGLEKQIFDDLAKAVQVTPSIRSQWLQNALSEKFVEKPELQFTQDLEERNLVIPRRRNTRENTESIGTLGDGSILVINRSS